MFHSEGKGGSDVVVPLLERFSGEAVDKIDTDIVDSGIPQCVDSIYNLCGIMSAAEKSEATVVECLCSHAHPIDRQRSQQRGKGRRDVVRIALNGHFFGVGAVDMRKEPLELFLGQCAWSAATDIYSLPFGGAIIRAQIEFATQCPHIFFLHASGCGGIEGAIDATRLTKGNMNV